MALPTPPGYRPLTEDSLAPYLADRPALAALLGGGAADWHVREVGDGNLNLVYLVDGPAGALCVKQSLPYVRLVGEGWPMPLERAFFEHGCLSRHAAHAPDLVPKVHHYDPAMFTIVMEKLSPHIIMRQGMIQAIRYPKAPAHLAEYCARTLYHTSDLHLSAAERKTDMALFCANTELCKITEDLIFTDPYRTNERNRWTSPQLDTIKAAFERDTTVHLAISRLKARFMGAPEALIHGDLHTGSVMVTADDTRVIDPEFAFYGPMGFDLGAVIGNLLINYFCQDGHEAENRPADTDRGAYRSWVLAAIEEFWSRFAGRFLDLWRADNRGDAYHTDLFADPPGQAALEAERQGYMARLYADAVQFAAAKMIRRILGLAHNIDLEWIEDPDLRATCERRCLSLAREMLVSPGQFPNPSTLTARARAVRGWG